MVLCEHKHKPIKTGAVGGSRSATWSASASSSVDDPGTDKMASMGRSTARQRGIRELVVGWAAVLSSADAPSLDTAGVPGIL